MSHTQEPWRYTPAETEEDDGRIYVTTGANIVGSGSESIFRVDLDEIAGLDDANARRIVACVNACAGIPTEHLVRCNAISAVDEILSERNALKKQRDELLAALGKILYFGDAASSSVAREAIYAVRGAA